MRIIGINSGFGSGIQDACAALLVDGRLEFAIEEERLSRIKFSPGVIAVQAVDRILKAAGLQITDIDALAFHGYTWPSRIETQLRELFTHHWGYCPPIERHHHHLAHAASAFWSSGWEEALIITMDLSGDNACTQIVTADQNGLQVLKSFTRPQSLGIFYSAMTQLAGFRRDTDEYKMMGLSAYGDPQKFNLGDFLSYDQQGGYILNEKMIREIEPGQSFPQKQLPLYNKALRKKLLGDLFPTALTNDHSELRANIAASTQFQLESVVLDLVRFWTKKTGLNKICLAGGVALNCAMNRKIAELDEVDQLYIPPFAGDQGISIGTAMLSCHQRNGNVQSLKSPYKGFAYTDEEITSILSICGVSHEKLVDPAKHAAELIHQGQIIAWFQGRSEIGPRALGNRSILASPLKKGMKNAINARIKFREAFRPFCPSVLAEDAGNYFTQVNTNYAYMNVNALVKEEVLQIVPEIAHEDGTSRPQTVSRESNGLFYDLLLHLKELSGHGMVLNTSFNVRNHPMVEHPLNALECFYSSGLDALILGSFVIRK